MYERYVCMNLLVLYILFLGLVWYFDFGSGFMMADVRGLVWFGILSSLVGSDCFWRFWDLGIPLD